MLYYLETECAHIELRKVIMHVFILLQWKAVKKYSLKEFSHFYVVIYIYVI